MAKIIKNDEELLNNSLKTSKNNTQELSSVAKTDTALPLGVDESTYNKMTSNFKQSPLIDSADMRTDHSLVGLENLVSKEDIIDPSIKSGLEDSFYKPSSVKAADAWLSEQLTKIQSGKTSYTSQVQDMMDSIMNREKFSYDVDKDQLFQQALASSMNSGKQAMQDTMGQASALTGGYGSTYATTAANQTYNAYIEDAYNNLPQYYQMALEAYQMEGDEMYRQLGMLNDADEKEYNRNVTAYDATYQHRNRMYDEAYQLFRDEKSDLFSLANLQLTEHGQRVSDAYNYYNASSNYADKLYSREYNSWLDSVNQAYQNAQLLNNNAWSNKNFDYQVERDTVYDSQWEKDYLENIRQFNTKLEHDSSENALNREHDFAVIDKEYANTIARDKTLHGYDLETIDKEYANTIARDETLHGYDLEIIDKNHANNKEIVNINNDHDSAMQSERLAHDSSENEKNRAHDDKWNQAELDYKYTALNKSSSGSGGSGGSGKKSTITSTEMKTLEQVYTKAGGGTKGLEAVDSYLSSIGKNNLSEEATNGIISTLNGVDVPVYYQDWNMYGSDGKLLDGANDTKNRGFLGTSLWAGEDHNDVYTNGNKTMTYDDLKEAIENSDLDETTKKAKINALKNQSKK